MEAKEARVACAVQPDLTEGCHMKISSLKIDAAKIEAGAWVKDIPGLPGVAFKVRGLGNVASRSFRAKAIDAVPRADRVKGLSQAAAEKIETDDLVENILLDWSGIDADEDAPDGAPQPLAFSKVIAAKYLADPDFAVFKGGILYAAQVVADLGADDLADDLGN